VPGPDFPPDLRRLPAVGRPHAEARQDLDVMVTNDYCEQRNIIFLNPAGSQGPEDQGIPKMIYTPNIEELLVSGNPPGRIVARSDVR
jgi:hypothetical protein